LDFDTDGWSEHYLRLLAAVPDFDGIERVAVAVADVAEDSAVGGLAGHSGSKFERLVIAVAVAAVAAS